MPIKIFYSWQSDLPSKLNRNFIRTCLEKSVRELNKELELSDAERGELRAEDGVKGVPGTPDVANTIFERIDAADIFVADISIIGEISTGRRVPNPNVMIEYGRATKALSDGKILTVFNEAFGDWERDRPFDMRHKLRPLTYSLDEASSAAEREEQKEILKKLLKSGISAIIKSTDDVDTSEHKSLDQIAQRFNSQRQFDKEKSNFLSSREGVIAAQEAYEELARCVQLKVEELANEHRHLNFETFFSNGYLVIQGMGPVLVASWQNHFFNSLNDAKLDVSIYDGAPELPGFAPVFDRPNRIKQASYNYTIIQPGVPGYESTNPPHETFETANLAESVIQSYLEASDGFERPIRRRRR